jgi:predicted nucleic acid-binding protein
VPLVAVDTNVLAYAEGLQRTPGDLAKIAFSRKLLGALEAQVQSYVVPVQALAELHSLLVRRAVVDPSEASRRIGLLARIAVLAPSDEAVLHLAAGLAAAHKFQIYDCLILAAAAEAGCELLVSEDLHDGFVWRGVTVTNPFGTAFDARLAALVTP